MCVVLRAGRRVLRARASAYSRSLALTRALCIYAGAHPSLCAQTQGVMICYDMSNEASFDALDGWMEEAERNGIPSSACGVVCATKQEDSRRRQVAACDGRDWARARGYDFFETSASTGNGVDAAFEALLEKVVKSIGTALKVAGT